MGYSNFIYIMQRCKHLSHNSSSNNPKTCMFKVMGGLNSLKVSVRVKACMYGVCDPINRMMDMMNV